MLASDDANREFSGASNPDDRLHVTFFMKSTPNPFQTEKQGRQIFQDEEFVRIMVPGRSDLTIETPVLPDHKVRFPRQWAVFKNQQGTDEQIVGTPLAEWPILTRAQVDELRGKRFYTVEQLADCSDAQIATLGMNANNLRLKARAFLTAARDTALAQQQATEIAKRDAENAELRERLARLEEALAGKESAPKRGRKKRELSQEERQAIADRFRKGREEAAARRAAQSTAEETAGL